MQAGLAPICQIIANMRHASAPKNVLDFVPSIQLMHPRQLDPASHSSSPAASIAAKVTPSTPGAPSFRARLTVGINSAIHNMFKCCATAAKRGT
jgi:hypothetical protein